MTLNTNSTANLVERRREDYIKTWNNGMVSKYTACSNVIAKEVSDLYNSDPSSFRHWQNDFLGKKFTRLLKTSGDCPPELVGDLVNKSLNLLRGDSVLRNLLIVSDDKFVEAVLTRLVEMCLSETVMNYGLDRPYEDPKKIKKIKKLLVRATSAASIAQTAAKIWGWRSENERVPLPPPIAAPSKLASENYYVYVCGSGKNSKRVLKSTSSISTSFKDGTIPLPKVFMPFQSKISNEPLELQLCGQENIQASGADEESLTTVPEVALGTIADAITPVEIPNSTESDSSDSPKSQKRAFKRRSSEKILRPGRGRPPKNATIVRTIRGTLDRRIHKLKATGKETTRKGPKPKTLHRSRGTQDKDDLDSSFGNASDISGDATSEAPAEIDDEHSGEPVQGRKRRERNDIEEQVEAVGIEKHVENSSSHAAEPPDYYTKEPTSILDLFSGFSGIGDEPNETDVHAPPAAEKANEEKPLISKDAEKLEGRRTRKTVEKRKTEETVWDMVQKHHRTRGTVKKPKVVEQSTKNTYSDFVGNEMENLIREHSHVSEHVPSSQTEPYADAYKKPKSLKWSAADTKRFYNAIEMFGSDLMLVRAFLSEFTDRQVYDKFKLEERKNPQLVKNALKIHRNISLGQYELKHGKIDVNTHYDPNKDPFLTDDAPTKKNTLSLNHEPKPIEIASETPQVGDILNLFM
ncbi:hypothetical protein BEWA_013110 [Theileria equi strain WA]|uniref:Transcription factor TFIIIB component B'' Myb domain-containing protein n=1 Tax=Theileria equi strain WA TaxID=1537102 RepID=L1LBG6_THEEQ|nr:hypothetical protein BEWA_013110 [Theileria equi strain WA]EKX72752.1 hypothetical protein BEWA_013110 [Theileria equi strain WA]|eukprot:XP_004832204.1 hypothetical protein BEWA_013110 [Theileria equi strain WA]